MSDVNFGTGTFHVGMDASQMGQATGQALGYMASLEQAVATNWWGIKNLGVAFAALPAAVVAGIGASIRAAMQWEDAMAGVEKTTYDTALSTEENSKQLSELEGQLLSLSRSKPIPSVEIAGIAENLAALGVLQQDIPKATDVVADFGATTGVSLEEAGTALVRLAALTNTPIAGLDNLASAILETGRATAATEEQIISVANRINGVGATFKVSAPDIIGWSAAMASAGIKAEAAGTAFQKTFQDINRAVSENGSELEVWAKLTGKSAQEFAAGFRDNSSQAVSEVVQALAALQKSGGDVDGTLARLGITESRQVRLLTTLAAAQNSTSNENIKLTNVLGLSNEAFADGSALAEIAEKRYGTLSSQLQLLWNNFFELANAIGGVFLPALKFMVDALQNLAAGFRVMPGPIKLVLAVLVGLTTAILGLLAAVFLIVPRFVLAYSAMRQFTVSMREAGAAEAQRVGSLQALAVGLEKSAAATAVATVAASQSIAAQKAAAAAELARANALIEQGAAQARAMAAETAYTEATISLANARRAVAAAEAEARTAQGAQWSIVIRNVMAAEAELAAAQTRLVVASENLDRSNVELIVSTSALSAATKAGAAADGQAAVAKQASAIATSEAAAANVAGAGATAASSTAASGGALSFLKFGKAAGGAGGEVKLLSRLTSSAGKAFGYAAIAMVAFTAITAAFGDRQRDAEEAAAKAEAANKKLTASLIDNTNAGRKQVQQWIRSQAASKGLISQAEDLGITYDELFKIISGSASAKEYQSFIKTLESGNNKGKDGVREFAGEVRQLNRIVAASKDEALAQGASFDDLSGSLQGAAGSADEFSEAMIGAEEATRRAGASTSYVEALFAEVDANFAVEDATNALGAARDRAGDRALEVQKAEISLTRARLQAGRTAQQVRDAENSLATARARQSEAVIKASNDLADARDSYADSLLGVEEAEERIKDLQDPRGAEELRKAVLDLADAEKSLRDAQQKSSDAQWYLNYLREEGAGARDIKVANNEIADAALEVAKAQEEQGEAQENLAKLNDPQEKAEALAKANRDLAAAHRSVEDAAIAVNESERNLASARSDQATNRLVKDAEADLADARLGVTEGTIAVKDAEAELNEARRNQNVDDLARQTAAYEQALFRQAQAIAETKKQTELLAGEEVTAADEAHFLGDALEQVLENVPDSDAKKRLQEFVDILKDAPDIPVAEDALGGETAPGGAPESGFGGKDPLEEYKKAFTGPSLWETIKKTVMENIPAIFSAAGSIILPALAAGAAEGALIGSFAGPIGTVAGAIVGLLVGLLVQLFVKNWDKIASAVTGFVKKVPSYLSSLVGVIGRFLSRLPSQLGYAAGFLLGIIAKAVVYAIAGMGKLIWELGKGIWAGIKLAIKGIGYLLSDEFGEMMEEGIKDAWSTITTAQWWTDRFNEFTAGVEIAAGGIYSFFQGIGSDIIKGIWQGFSDAWPEGAKWLEDAWDGMIKWLREFFGIASPSKKMAEIGRWIIEGMWNGIKEAWDAGWKFFTELPGKVIDVGVDAATWLVSTGIDLIGGLWSGMKTAWDLVTSWLYGIGEKLITKVKGGLGMLGKGGGKLLQIGKDIFGGMWDGLKEVWEDIIDWLKERIDDIPQFIKDFFDIKSPSRLMAGLGKNIGLGLGEGLKAGMSTAVKDFEKMANELNPSMIEDQFRNFGIDTLDVAAFTGQVPAVPTALGVATSAVPAVAIGDASAEPTVREAHYHLEAITAANPKEIMDEFAWGENIKTRGNQ